ncbi:hypothetical protein [Pedobacter soli]|uniref:Uncharacterized protein n=1 Tax=Pedobacter soli TaxID=390242 RepID=A0A1G6WZP1_9SPHI|nr:hypothetical protein [Pedobacter soli]SDD70465.1 hypothetical protein SAMN04488024_107153 [Pedobacter soli]
MVYEFIFFEEHFHHLITKTTFPKNFSTESSKSLDKEYSRLIRVFRDIAVLGKKKKKIITYFNFHQKNLIILIDKVYQQSEAQKSNQGRKTILPLLEQLITKMIAFLEWTQKMFPKFFNANEKLPKIILLTELEKIEAKIRLVIDELKKRKFRDEFSGLMKVIGDTKLITNYREIAYWHATWNIIYCRLIAHDIRDEFGILKVMIENGMNHSEFYRFTKNFISQEVEKKPTLDEQISSICGFRKEIRLLFGKTNSKQFSEYPEIKKMLKNFIKEELLMLRAMEFVNHGLAEAGIMNANYKVSFSVKQLAFFVHLQMETGIIIWQRAKFAHQYIARHFSTVERDSISEKSVRNAHYNHAGEDIKKVIAKLGEMLALAQERY